MLRDVQNTVATALRDGPDSLPRGLFAGNERRVLLAMAAHANTISHGRLVALEDSFPLTRCAIGDAVFNQLSRDYIDAGLGVDGALNDIGDAFPDWLDARGQGTNLVAIARFDHAFIAAHHASDEDALTLADLPEDADVLMAMRLSRHSAASAHETSPTLLDAVEQPDWTEASAILITRPDVVVRLSPLNQPAYDAWCVLAAPVTFAELCTNMGARHDDVAIIPAIIALVRAGALQQENTI